MADALIRPSLKFIKLGYVLTILLLVGALIAYAAVLKSEKTGPWLPVLAAVLVLWPAARHFRRQFIKLSLTGDKLRYECGFLSRSTRTIPISKVQDVRVDQSLGQRMFGVGNVSIETAGGTSRLTVKNLDCPQAVADEIMDASGKGGSKEQASAS